MHPRGVGSIEATVRRLLLWLNSPFAWAIFLTVSLVNLVVGFVAQALALPWDPHRLTALKVNHWIWGKGLWAAEPGWPMTRQGLENVGPGPYIIVANHSSVLDIPTLMGLPVPMRVMAKRSLIKAPIMGWYMQFSRQIPIQRDSPESVQESLRMCQESLDNGISLVIFPEGTRTQDATLQKFRRGAFRLAKDTGTPILPVGICGTHRLVMKGSFLPQSLYHPVHCKVLPAVDPAGYSTARKLSNRVHEQIAGTLDELRSVQALPHA